jgi:uncharacterized protein YcbX
MANLEGDLEGTLAALRCHPIKSCAGFEVEEALLVETGLDLDRAWMVVDAEGEMLTQRELPRMALVRPQWRGDSLLLRAPGMLALHVSLDAVDSLEPRRVRVWGDTVRAFDMGALAAQWFSDCLGRKGLRLVRFDPDQKRLSEKRWTGAIDAENAFADGFPLLVVNLASLADLNARLAERGAAPVGIERFRPNLVLDGVPAWDEDHLDAITIEAEGGAVVVKLVKPCVRCSIPNTDPASAEVGAEPGATMALFRSDARMGGGLTFGMNAVIAEGIDRVLRPGQRFSARYGV